LIFINYSIGICASDIFQQIFLNDRCTQSHKETNRKFTLTLNHPSLQNKTTDVVIRQHRRKLLMMDILMSETC